MPRSFDGGLLAKLTKVNRNKSLLTDCDLLHHCIILSYSDEGYSIRIIA